MSFLPNLSNFGSNLIANTTGFAKKLFSREKKVEEPNLTIKRCTIAYIITMLTLLMLTIVGFITTIFFIVPGLLIGLISLALLIVGLCLTPCFYYIVAKYTSIESIPKSSQNGNTLGHLFSSRKKTRRTHSHTAIETSTGGEKPTKTTKRLSSSSSESSGKSSRSRHKQSVPRPQTPSKNEEEIHSDDSLLSSRSSSPTPEKQSLSPRRGRWW
ncbi:hypothetical protein [Candidatus Chlamydia sanziniae]|uniref:Uncharacterized protein n=1 Tax=Candidatus Chlamydia sanziniae TaxID=1806891 RepID=A0A1A9HVY4_9CHLA|nr:hypothetical protein [Candidatus Chlamydia sanziniae]ANH78204.1 hypothetical protein Cs308_0028 [Candidatus Chlamydia sanziniae]